MFSGRLLEQNGGDVLLVCQADQEMGVAMQARGFREAGTMGIRTGKEERKTTTLGMVPVSESSTSDINVQMTDDRSGGEGVKG
jgi:hypothetical protein